MKKLTAMLLCLMMLSTALAEIEWPVTLTNGQAALRNFVDEVNLTLIQQKAGVIDMAYEVYTAFASLGLNGEEAPETAEMQFLLGEDGLHSLVLRSCDADQFEQVAAACLMASSTLVTEEDAKALVASYAKVMRADMQNRTSSSDAMTHSFEEDVIELQDDRPRAYFAYYPNQYGDGHSWLQMTLIFARPGSEDAPLGLAVATPAPTTDEEYEGYFSHDNYSHLEIFATPTPEPDSAAMEP